MGAVNNCQLLQLMLLDSGPCEYTQCLYHHLRRVRVLLQACITLQLQSLESTVIASPFAIFDLGNLRMELIYSCTTNYPSRLTFYKTINNCFKSYRNIPSCCKQSFNTYRTTGMNSTCTNANLLNKNIR